MAVRGVQIADRLQRVDPLVAGLADADQDAGGERHLQLAGQTQGLQPHRRMLVGRAVVDAARLAEPLAGRLQHDALAGVTARRPAISSRVITPGLACGSSPVSRSTSAHIAAR